MLVAEVVTCKSGGQLDPGQLALYRLHFLAAFFPQSYHENQERGPFWNCLYLHLRHGTASRGYFRDTTANDTQDTGAVP